MYPSVHTMHVCTVCVHILYVHTYALYVYTYCMFISMHCMCISSFPGLWNEASVYLHSP